MVMIKAGIEAYLQCDKPSPDLQATAEKIAGLLPMFFTAYVFKLGSGALLAVIFSYWSILVYVAGLVIFAPVLPLLEKRLRLSLTAGFALHPLGIMRRPPVRTHTGERERMTHLLLVHCHQHRAHHCNDSGIDQPQQKPADVEILL